MHYGWRFPVADGRKFCFSSWHSKDYPEHVQHPFVFVVRCTSIMRCYHKHSANLHIGVPNVNTGEPDLPHAFITEEEKEESQLDP